LARLRVAAHHLADELGLGPGDIGQRLALFRHPLEVDEIDRVAVAQGDADLAVGLEPADAAAMAGPRIDDDIGPLPVHRFAARRAAGCAAADSSTDAARSAPSITTS
jgi:hypothetical protein